MSRRIHGGEGYTVEKDTQGRRIQGGGGIHRGEGYIGEKEYTAEGN